MVCAFFAAVFIVEKEETEKTEKVSVRGKNCGIDKIAHGNRAQHTSTTTATKIIKRENERERHTEAGGWEKVNEKTIKKIEENLSIL